MRIVSPFLKRVVYPSLSAAGVLHRTAPPGLAVVTYHGVLPEEYKPVDPAFDGNLIRPEALRQQLRLLKSHYNVISPEDALAWLRRNELPPRAVLLTCDDGLLNHLTDMLPVLQEEGMKCLFFATAASAGEERKTLWYEDLFLLLISMPEGAFDFSRGAVEIRGDLRSREQRRSVWWNSVKRLSQLDAGARSDFVAALRERIDSASFRGFDGSDPIACRRFGLMTCGELRKLSAAGMTIGAHTVSHPVLSQMAPELAFAEIAESRSLLESALQKNLWAFAYPFGDARSVTPQVLTFPQRAGFAAAFMNFGGGLGTALPPFALPRIHVTSETTLSELDAYVSGFYARLRRSSQTAKV
jgi:peptidoglycan/xylan/chitin deacetylase (PgdA/CDA1 family)